MIPRRVVGSRATSDKHGAVSFRHGTEEARDAEEKVGGVWTVTDYERTQGSGEGKFTDKVKVYSNRTGPNSIPVAKWFPDQGAKDSFTANAGDYTAAERRISLGTGIDHSIDSPEFPESGTLNFPAKDGAEEIQVRGSYRGAPGYYYCTPGTGTCDVGVGTGGYFLQTPSNADWMFVHDEGARVIHPDYHFAYFGWWLREDDDALLGGGATFEGPVVGQYAIHDPLDGKGEGGAFTATALLKAKFGTTTTVPDTGMTGTVDKFLAREQPDGPATVVFDLEEIDGLHPGLRAPGHQPVPTPSGPVSPSPPPTDESAPSVRDSPTPTNRTGPHIRPGVTDLDRLGAVIRRRARRCRGRSRSGRGLND